MQLEGHTTHKYKLAYVQAHAKGVQVSNIYAFLMTVLSLYKMIKNLKAKFLNIFKKTITRYDKLYKIT